MYPGGRAITLVTVAEGGVVSVVWHETVMHIRTVKKTILMLCFAFKILENIFVCCAGVSSHDAKSDT